jgi:Dolichyl-phosphate-mannose-protein mannosyltransferase
MSLVRRRLLIVLAVLLVATVIKLVYAGWTLGSNDTGHYRDFAAYVAKYGPIGIYGHWTAAPPYNHPPLVGWILALLNLVAHTGLKMTLLVRLPAILADVVTTLVVFAVLRSYRSLRTATAGAVVVALSPILIIISGYHGNTDPIFLMFAFLAFFCLYRRNSAAMAALGGLCFGLSISVKLVPIVIGPLLAVMALRAGWRRLAAFAGGAAVVFLALWVPVLAQQWAPFKTNVLGYAGYGPPRWGIVEFLVQIGASDHVLSIAQGPGRFAAVALAALVPAALAGRRPELAPVAFGLTLSTFLLLSTATATQYLTWAAAPAVLVGVGVGAVYNVAAGILLIDVYDGWSGAAPWAWHQAKAHPMGPGQTFGAGLVWVTLLAVVLHGLWQGRPSRTTPAEPDPSPRERIDAPAPSR